eukprot:1161363-Pelagomonas_calceolata.AAC.5
MIFFGTRTAGRVNHCCSLPNFSGPAGAFRARTFDAGKIPPCACGSEGKREHWMLRCGNGLKWLPSRDWSMQDIGFGRAQSFERVSPDLDLAISQERLTVTGPKDTYAGSMQKTPVFGPQITSSGIMSRSSVQPVHAMLIFQLLNTRTNRGRLPLQNTWEDNV